MLNKLLILALIAFSNGYTEEDDTIARNDSCRTYRRYQNSYSRQPKKTDNYLYVIHAKDGHLAQASQDQYVLTLYQVDKNVTYLSNCADKKAGKMSVSHFIQEWDASLDETNPNVILVSDIDFRERSQFSDIPVELSDPEYEQGMNRLHFSVKLLQQNQKIPLGDLGETTLFVDRFTNGR